MTNNYSAKPRYELLDGLRGVAALMVLCYHIFEGFASSPLDQHFNHGYLAVDFFFILSGFVIGYAYDDRWGRMRLGDFFRRRLIRLHPMVILAAVFGFAAFLVQGCTRWDGSAVEIGWIMASLVMTMLMLPVWPGSPAEVRGNGEMFPLNGPSWSLFFEYIGNMLYAFVIRLLPSKWLRLWVFAIGTGLISYVFQNPTGYFYLGVGWTMGDSGFWGGLLRMSFSFSMGLLLSRDFRPVRVRHAFWICSAAIVILLSIPYVGGPEPSVLNALYDVSCIVCLFPAILYIGASGVSEGGRSGRICDFLGRISYPVYIIHYPLMYLFYWWVWKNGYTFGQVWPAAICVVTGAIILAFAALKLYDEPVRKFLQNRYGKN